MAKTKISELPVYTGDTTGVFVVMNSADLSTTYRVAKENLTGVSGSNGSSGTSGSNGSSGTSGTNGTSGSSGTSGSNGSSGTSGVNGSSGTSGSNGTDGSSGSGGTSGTSGSNGSSGTSGNTGSSGTSGTSGYVDNDWLFFTPSTSTIPSTGNNFVLSGTTTSNGSVSYNQSTGIITLAANKTYKLDASLALANSASNSEVNYRWINVTNSNTAIGNVGAVLVNNTTAQAAWQPIATAIIVTTGTTQVALRSIFSDSIGGLNTTMCRFIVNQINGWSGSSGTSGSNGSSGTSGSNGSSGTSGVVSYTGLITSGSLGGTQSITGSLNVNGNLTVGTSSGDEGGEINLALAQTNNNLTGSINIDIWRNRLRFWEGGGNARGAYLDLTRQAAGVGSEILTKASGIVNAGDYVILGDLKARIPTSGYRSLQVATIASGVTYSVIGSGIYNQGGAIAGITIQSGSPLSVTSTPAYLNAAAGFGTYGAIDTWNIMDTTVGIAWRISCIIGPSFNSNLITIERLH